MSTTATNLPPWAEITLAATLRAAENKLAAVSVDAESLRLLWNAWRNEKDRAAKMEEAFNFETTANARLEHQRAEMISELDSIKHRFDNLLRQT